MSNYLAHSCLAYKLFTYHSFSVELIQLACLLIFLLRAHIPLKLIMYHWKGRCLNLCPSSGFIIWAPISTFPGPQEPARLSPGSTLYEELPAKTLPGMSRLFSTSCITEVRQWQEGESTQIGKPPDFSVGASQTRCLWATRSAWDRGDSCRHLCRQMPLLLWE